MSNTFRNRYLPLGGLLPQVITILRFLNEMKNRHLFGANAGALVVCRRETTIREDCGRAPWQSRESLLPISVVISNKLCIETQLDFYRVQLTSK